MATTKQLMEIKYHTDSETGIYSVGEVDFGIYGTLEEYLEEYGWRGENEIISILAYLIYEVKSRGKIIRENNSERIGGE